MAKWFNDLVDLIRTNMLALTGLGLILGAIGLIFGIYGLFVEALTDFDVVIVVVAILDLLLCGAYFTDYYTATQEFDELVNTQSRAKFKKNQGDLEKLALKLGPQKEEDYFRAKKRLNIR